MLIIRSKVAKLVKIHGKRMSKDAWQALDARVEGIVNRACNMCGSHKTVRETEILLALNK
jgi:hypothetical protein